MPVAKASNTISAHADQPSFETDLSAFEESVDQFRALTLMLGDTLENSGLSPYASGMMGLFLRFVGDFDRHFETVRTDRERVAEAYLVKQAAKPRRHLTTADVPTDAERMALRREYIGLIMRDTDTTAICERYALPKETLRDILFAMIDAPQKTVAVEGMRDVRPVQPLDEHFGEEAIIDRLTGAAGEESEAG